MSSQTIFIILGAVIMGWFAYGMIYNLRRGDAVLKWMQGGLPRIGQRTTFRWLGTSVAEMGIAHAKRPFRRLDTLLVLKPRDVFWMTIIAYFQGREDIVIYRAQLTIAPLVDLELVDPRTWSGRSAMKQASQRRWESRAYGDGGHQLLAPMGLLDLASKTVDRLAAPMEKLSGQYARFGLRRDKPNLELHVPFPAVRTRDPAEYFEALRELAHAIGERE